MNGFHTGILRVFTNTGNGREIKWALQGDQMQDWKQAAVDLTINNPREVSNARPNHNVTRGPSLL